MDGKAINPIYRVVCVDADGCWRLVDKIISQKSSQTVVCPTQETTSFYEADARRSTLVMYV